MKANSDFFLAWHFLEKSKKLRYGDDRLAAVGRILSVGGPIKLCQNGLHGSIRLMDALHYAPGFILSRVKIWGNVDKEDDKICGRCREILWMKDVTDEINEFSYLCVKRALSWERNPNRKLWDVIEMRWKWMSGVVTDEELEQAISDSAVFLHTINPHIACAISCFFAEHNNNDISIINNVFNMAIHTANAAATIGNAHNKITHKHEFEWQEKTLLALINTSLPQF